MYKYFYLKNCLTVNEIKSVENMFQLYSVIADKLLHELVVNDMI